MTRIFEIENLRNFVQKIRKEKRFEIFLRDQIRHANDKIVSPNFKRKKINWTYKVVRLME